MAELEVPTGICRLWYAVELGHDFGDRVGDVEVRLLAGEAGVLVVGPDVSKQGTPTRVEGATRPRHRACAAPRCRRERAVLVEVSDGPVEWSVQLREETRVAHSADRARRGT